jgi:hypothetical protein
LENIFRLDEDYKNTLTSQRERYALSLSESSHLIMDAAAAGGILLNLYTSQQLVAWGWLKQFA